MQMVQRELFAVEAIPVNGFGACSAVRLAPIGPALARFAVRVRQAEPVVVSVYHRGIICSCEHSSDVSRCPHKLALSALGQVQAVRLAARQAMKGGA